MRAESAPTITFTYDVASLRACLLCLNPLKAHLAVRRLTTSNTMERIVEKNANMSSLEPLEA